MRFTGKYHTIRNNCRRRWQPSLKVSTSQIIPNLHQHILNENRLHIRMADVVALQKFDGHFLEFEHFISIHSQTLRGWITGRPAVENAE